MIIWSNMQQNVYSWKLISLLSRMILNSSMMATSFSTDC